MNISGILEQSSPVTLPRLLERIFDTDRPGELVLKHQNTGEQATLLISQGEVRNTVFGELKNEEAIRAINQTFPWIYEFKASGDTQGDGRLGGPNIIKQLPQRAVGARTPGVVIATKTERNPVETPPPAVGSTGSQPSQPTLKIAAKAKFKPPGSTVASLATEPAAKAVEKTEPSATKLKTRKDRPYLRVLGVRLAGEKSSAQSDSEYLPTPVLDLRAVHTTESLRPWVLTTNTGSLRFFDFDGTHFGDLTQEEWAYFRADRLFMMKMAATIGNALGYGRANMVAVVEPQRAACYWSINDGFAGAYQGNESSITDFISKL
jgi:hypothetical protein